MSSSKKILLLISVAAGLGFAGCQTSRTTLPTSDLAVPETYAGAYDTVSMANVRWDRFFADEALNSLIGSALENNIDLRIAMQRIEMSRAGILAARGAMLPTLGADISAGGRKFGDYTMDGVGNWDTNFSPNIDEKQSIPTGFLPDYYLGVRSSWEVDLWGKLRTLRQAAQDRFIASEHGRNLIVTSLISEIAGEYYHLLALDSELAIMRYNIDLQTKATETVLNLKQAGRANELAVNQFTAQLLNSKGALANISQEIIASENRLNMLLGRFPQPIPRGEPLRLRDFPDSISTGIPVQMLGRRPDILQAQSELLASHAELRAADLAFLPSLNISADLGVQSFKSGLIFAPGSLAYGILGGLSAPLLNRKALKANRLMREAEMKEALLRYNKLVLSGFSEIATDLKRLEKLEEMYDLKQEEVSELRQAVAVSNELFIVGAASYLEVVTAQNGVISAEVDLIQIRKQQFLTLLQVYRSLGGGW
ncbi:MAG: RND transporter [Cytophagaceae bacterium SCN 52-12]|nr:MAG: RND transporter [Cytophagaceae bacterium SCN 52-12]